MLSRFRGFPLQWSLLLATWIPSNQSAGHPNAEKVYAIHRSQHALAFKNGSVLGLVHFSLLHSVTCWSVLRPKLFGRVWRQTSFWYTERKRERERDSNSVKFQVTSPRLFKGAYLKKACCNHSPSPSIRPPSCFRQQVRIQPQQSRMVRRMQRTALNSGSVSFAVAEHAQWCGN